MDGDLRQHGFKKLKALFAATTLLITTTPACKLIANKSAGNLVADKSCQEKLIKKQEDFVGVLGTLEFFANALLNNQKDPQAREMEREAKIEAGNVLYSQNACRELDNLTKMYQSQRRKTDADESKAMWQRLCATNTTPQPR